MRTICQDCGAEISKGKPGQENRIVLDICDDCHTKDCLMQEEELEKPEANSDETFLPEPNDSPVDWDLLDDNDYDTAEEWDDSPADYDWLNYNHDRAEKCKEAWLAGADLDEEEYLDENYDWDLPEDWFLSVSG